MSELYRASLLLSAGTCIALALQALVLARIGKNSQYIRLFVFGLCGALSAFATARITPVDTSGDGLLWGQGLCLFAPCVAYLFGQLCLSLVAAPRWLLQVQGANLFLTTLFAGLGLADMLLGSTFVLEPWLLSELDEVPRLPVHASSLAKLYLSLSGVSASLCVWGLVAAEGSRVGQDAATRAKARELRPIQLAATSYVACLWLDYASLMDLRDGVLLQPFGLLALWVGCFRSMLSRFQRTLAKLQGRVEELEDQRKQLLSSPGVVQKQRLDGLGALVAAVAHEIINPIQGVLSYTTLLKGALHDPRAAVDYLEKIDSEGERVARIARGLLRFGRADETEAKLADLGEIVRSTLALAQNAVRQEGIALRVTVATELPLVRCRPYQLQQILLNLINNARDALASRCPNRTDEKAIQIAVDKELRSGLPWVTFAVADNGNGIDPEVQARLFNPFFTTKGDSGGTGLGLAISHSIAEAHGGSLRLAQTHQRGSTFLVELPCKREEALEQASA
jgi:signal transduction histidine kinase